MNFLTFFHFLELFSLILTDFQWFWWKIHHTDQFTLNHTKPEAETVTTMPTNVSEQFRVKRVVHRHGISSSRSNFVCQSLIYFCWIICTSTQAKSSHSDCIVKVLPTKLFASIKRHGCDSCCLCCCMVRLVSVTTQSLSWKSVTIIKNEAKIRENSS